MFSFFSSAAQPSQEHKSDEPYPDLGKEYDPDNCYEELLMYYEGRDTTVWIE